MSLKVEGAALGTARSGLVVAHMEDNRQAVGLKEENESNRKAALLDAFPELMHDDWESAHAQDEYGVALVDDDEWQAETIFER